MNENKQAEPVALVKLTPQQLLDAYMSGRENRPPGMERDALHICGIVCVQAAVLAAQNNSAPAVAQEPVGEVKAKQGSTGTFVQWYKQPQPGDKLYTEPPAVAVNEQLLEALKLAEPCLKWMVVNQGIRGDVPEKFSKIKAAISAAEQMKGGV